jgi:hypothetical protein
MLTEMLESVLESSEPASGLYRACPEAPATKPIIPRNESRPPAERPQPGPQSHAAGASRPRAGTDTASPSPAAFEMLQQWERDQTAARAHQPQPPADVHDPGPPKTAPLLQEERHQLLTEFHAITTVQLLKVMSPQETSDRATAMVSLAREDWLQGCGSPEDPREKTLCDIALICSHAGAECLRRAMASPQVPHSHMLVNAATKLFGECRKAAMASSALQKNRQHANAADQPAHADSAPNGRQTTELRSNELAGAAGPPTEPAIPNVETNRTTELVSKPSGADDAGEPDSTEPTALASAPAQAA